MFDYVDPRNRAVQIEMEKVATEHLKQIGAYLKPEFKPVTFDDDKANPAVRVRSLRHHPGAQSRQDHRRRGRFRPQTEDQVPLQPDRRRQSFDRRHERTSRRDRRKRQIGSFTSFPSARTWASADAGTTACITPSAGDSRFNSTATTSTGRFDDSADRRRASANEKCAMVIGSYRMTNFKLEEIPPGVIDHRNGRRTMAETTRCASTGWVRRAQFYTPILRKLKIPNVSYGEDYAVGLAISPRASDRADLRAALSVPALGRQQRRGSGRREDEHVQRVQGQAAHAGNPGAAADECAESRMTDMKSVALMCGAPRRARDCIEPKRTGSRIWPEDFDE